MIMKRGLFFQMAILASTFFFLSSCDKHIVKGNGSIGSEERSITNFSRVLLECEGTIQIDKGPAFKVVVTDDDNLLSYVKTRLVGDELRVSYKDNTWVRKGSLVVKVTMPDLSDVKVDSKGTIDVIGNFDFAGTLSASVDGLGKIYLRDAQANELKLNIDGKGDIYAFGLKTKKATVKIDGMGDAEINVSDAMDVNISGAGDVYYMGNPPVINSKISGKGKIIKR